MVSPVSSHISTAFLSASITGWRSCSHENSLAASVVTMANVYSGSVSPANPSAALVPSVNRRGEGVKTTERKAYQ